MKSNFTAPIAQKREKAGVSKGRKAKPKTAMVVEVIFTQPSDRFSRSIFGAFSILETKYEKVSHAQAKLQSLQGSYLGDSYSFVIDLKAEQIKMSDKFGSFMYWVEKYFPDVDSRFGLGKTASSIEECIYIFLKEVKQVRGDSFEQHSFESLLGFLFSDWKKSANFKCRKSFF